MNIVINRAAHTTQTIPYPTSIGVLPCAVKIPCIINKIPLIMCGKPGTSKSLSFQILYDSMKGERSDNEFLNSERVV